MLHALFQGTGDDSIGYPVFIEDVLIPFVLHCAKLRITSRAILHKREIRGTE